MTEKISCGKCGGYIDPSTNVCERCGYTIAQGRIKTALLLFVLALVIILVLVKILL